MRLEMEISDTETTKSIEKKKEEEDNSSFTFKPVGKIVTCFTEKNGTPRQGLLCTMAKAMLTVDFGVPNPQHSLEELEKYSHVWLLFVFHQNSNTAIKSKISPPRLEGKRVGLFATRTPHRPNPIGLSIAKLDQIKGNTLYLSGVDLVSGTPILDVKPYIATYDSVPHATAPEWITEAPRSRLNNIKFTEEAEKQLQVLVPKLRFYKSFEEIRTAIEEVLLQDPRSVHFKESWAEESYGFCIDILNVICNFHDDLTATVKEVQDWSHKYTKDELPAPPSKRQKKLQEKRAKMNIDQVSNKEKS